ncbi:hypothetical protein GWN63_02515 [Candidatus Bathyarchaeota archaeon]|nr:hypothetical protein [Candidatus Bathyarchaeota archaeon]NIU81104.1 hypothetical protein [Candidatus Bathyarchaeota archaeon]NIV67740.1 hypothetical protein [Candidatus Bathyarchaeota archaeon]
MSLLTEGGLQKADKHRIKPIEASRKKINLRPPSLSSGNFWGTRLSGKVERVQTWERFKEPLRRFRPEEIYYAQGNAPLSRPPVELRLTFTSQDRQYVFIDTGKDNYLRRTGIPVHLDQHGNYNIKEEEIKKFIHTELERTDIKVRSFELMGGY